MNKGEAAMRAEFERLLPAMRSGGYIPSVDHQTPPGVSLEDYRVYVRLFREYAEAAARAAPLGGGLAGREGARAPLRVLFLGNSQVRWACDVPEIVARLSRSAPDGVARIETDAVTVGGASLEALWRDGRPAAKLAAGGWDWVVCNELIYSYGGNSAAFREYARRFSEAAGKAGARILFFATGETAAARLASGPMHQDSLAMARACGGRVAGCGAAWLKAWEQRPALDLHHADRAHPNLLGYYLNACVLYAALTDCPPAGLDACGLPAEDAAFLQDIAWRQSVEDRRNETCVP